ncbi:MAG TPA: PilN domain-containing protein [Vicinamibacteria bacterium]|jgi:type IV pilus assembly protein PilN|nr:PilN domain-containing protein [Vicinamibacteria bacterium]
MIRINLLAPERPTQKKKGGGTAGGPSGVQAYLLLFLFAGGALLLCGGLWALKVSNIAHLDKQIADAEKREQQLKAIKVQVDAFEAKKKMLDAKVALIEQLKAQQGGPVHLLDEVSKALPDFVWLTGLDQTGNVIRFQGESNGLSAVADFISNLQQAGENCGKPRPQDRSLCYFPRVELNTSNENNGVVAFTLSVDFQNADALAKQKAAAAETAAAAPTPPAPVKKP